MFQNTDKQLPAGEKCFVTLAQQSSEVIILINRDGIIIYHNDATDKYLGLKRKEIIGSAWHDHVHPDEKDIITRAFSRLLTNVSAPVQKAEIRLRHKDETWRTFEAAAGNLTQNNVVEAVIINLHDITARQRAEDTLKKIEKRYRLLAEHMKDQLWIMDLNLNLSYATPSVERLLGYTFEELKIITLNKLLTAESFTKAMDFYSREMSIALAASSGYLLKHPLELEFCSKDGQTIWGECMFSFIRNDDGKPIALLGESRNITERKQMEDALRKSEENFRHSLDESPLGVRIATKEGKTIYANRAILDIYGYDHVEELENTPLQNRYTKKSCDEYQARKAKRMNGEFVPSEYEISIIRKSGEMRHLHVFRKDIFWNGQKQSQVIYQDITSRKQTEEKLSRVLENLRRSIKVTMQVLGMTAEAKDPYVAGHQKRVSDLARAIATEMKLPQEKIESIRIAGSIHDIGKISIPSEILCKPSVLSSLEFSLIKGHSQRGYEIIREVESPWPLANIILQHHERLNGTGYPEGLREEDILMEARIIAVADVVEAMISHRPYRPALNLEQALEEIKNNAGVIYDRHVSEACLVLFQEKGYRMVPTDVNQL